MLKVGYTAVGEFHYLHHDVDGRPYADFAELSERVIAAAQTTGIGLTHLPVLYGYGGFGGPPGRRRPRGLLPAVKWFPGPFQTPLHRPRGGSRLDVSCG